MKKYKALIKISISLVIVWAILRVVDLGALWRTLSNVSPLMGVLILLGYLAGQVLSSFKWWTIARSGGIDASYLVTFRAYFAGMFVNCFGFGVVGGDMARGILLAAGSEEKAGALTSVLADRLQGLAVLSALAVVCAATLGRQSLEPQLVLLLCAVGVGIVLSWFIGPIRSLRSSLANPRRSHSSPFSRSFSI